MYYFESKDKKRVHIFGRSTDVAPKEILLADGKVMKCAQFGVTIGEGFTGAIEWLGCSAWETSQAYRTALDIEKNDFIEVLGEIKRIAKNKQSLKCEFVRILYKGNEKKAKSKPERKEVYPDAPDDEIAF